MKRINVLGIFLTMGVVYGIGIQTGVCICRKAVENMVKDREKKFWRKH